MKVFRLIFLMLILLFVPVFSYANPDEAFEARLAANYPAARRVSLEFTNESATQRTFHVPEDCIRKSPFLRAPLENNEFTMPLSSDDQIHETSLKRALTYLCTDEFDPNDLSFDFEALVKIHHKYEFGNLHDKLIEMTNPKVLSNHIHLESVSVEKMLPVLEQLSGALDGIQNPEQSWLFKLRRNLVGLVRVKKINSLDEEVKITQYAESHPHFNQRFPGLADQYDSDAMNLVLKIKKDRILNPKSSGQKKTTSIDHLVDDATKELKKASRNFSGKGQFKTSIRLAGISKENRDRLLQILRQRFPHYSFSIPLEGSSRELMNDGGVCCLDSCCHDDCSRNKPSCISAGVGTLFAGLTYPLQILTGGYCNHCCSPEYKKNPPYHYPARQVVDPTARQMAEAGETCVNPFITNDCCTRTFYPHQSYESAYITTYNCMTHGRPELVVTESSGAPPNQIMAD